MEIAPPVHLVAYSHRDASIWEMVLRYFSATVATLVAIAGAQLIIRNEFTTPLAILTVAGVPVSLFLRLKDMRVGPVRILRPLWNGVVVLVTGIITFYWVILSLQDLWEPLLNGKGAQTFWLRFGAGEFVSLLIQVFLIFAAIRSFALISDKDATLATVPSFSVLLLLIPVHHGIEVVAYFLIWSVVATILFALDQRSEVRARVSAYVPSISPGQDVRLAARALATVLGTALIAAFGLSYFLTSRDPDERSAAETAITSLASRLTSAALSLPDISVNAGPERQIDFSSGPTLPSRAVLWSVSAWTRGAKAIHPEYWRMFTLNNYDGTSWSEGPTKSIKIQNQTLTRKRWPQLRDFPRPGINFDAYRLNQSPPPAAILYSGFDVGKRFPKMARHFGPDLQMVREDVIPTVANLGFVPLLPAVRGVRLNGSDTHEIGTRSDGSIDLGVVLPQQTIRILSDVPPLQEYGFARGRPPLQRIENVKFDLTPGERKVALQLPASLPVRVRQLARNALRESSANESNFARAERLALEIQNGATYTLRPPIVPTGRDATDFFLFEGGRRGYCTYFAGALVVLCRAEGIPAHIVSGFANTEWTSDGNGTLREANAHAWAEVWVEGWGWAIVDATPADDRGDNAPTWLESWGDWIASIFEDILAWTRDQLILVCMVGGALSMVLAVKTSRSSRFNLSWKRATPTEDDAERLAVVESYGRASRQMARRYRPRALWETPDEWLQSSSTILTPPDSEAFRRLTSLYLAARYGAERLPEGTAKMAKEMAARITWKRPDK